MALAEKLANVEAERKLAAARRVKDAEEQEHAYSKKGIQPATALEYEGASTVAATPTPHEAATKVALPPGKRYHCKCTIGHKSYACDSFFFLC
jgi:hypothetical protein